MSKLKLLFVTGNKGKLCEVQGFLSSCPHLEVEGVKMDLTEVQDRSAALISRTKAVEALRVVNKLADGQWTRGDGQPLTPVLVEDTSLCFDVLGDLPGPYIKWFLDAVGCEGLIHMIEGFEHSRRDYRAARALCIFSYCDGYDEGAGEARVHQFIGECVGRITPHPQGKNGFGWDPIFAPDADQVRRTPGTQSFAEMRMEEKIKCSHRTRALEKLLDHFLKAGEKRQRIHLEEELEDWREGNEEK